MFRYTLPFLTILAGCAMSPADQERQAAADASARAQIASKLQGLEPGEPVSCISRTQVRQADLLRGTILYHASGDLIYRNDLGRGCGNFDFDNDVLQTRSTINQICAGDIFTTVSRADGHFTGSCSFGKFTPYRRAEGEEP
ncbi:hypothetical protein [Stakelama saccharophila]|uniref:Lipoprotein n=1 Tax=Stakelama saccharophila TaxID=3075605 RepID=A0ABZ0B7L2_9SPHN|nr:hypothetical protein [Stakelama sp. W311]WNO53253.1 hypothetical protein RPR59_12485 [Stakelama sp. W311]